MRKSNLLVAVAVAGLIGGTTLAGAQRSNSSGMSNGGAGGAAAPSGAERSSPSTDSMGGTSAKPSAEHRSEKGSNAASSEPSEGHNQAAGQGGAAGPSGNTSNAANSGSTAKGGSASLSSEQRTKIHQTIVRQGNAPRVARVDFSVSVGTTVPRSVQLAAVPAAIIEIQPVWRGYEYFLVGERVVIVDPDTMQIVAIIVA